MSRVTQGTTSVTRATEGVTDVSDVIRLMESIRNDQIYQTGISSHIRRSAGPTAMAALAWPAFLIENGISTHQQLDFVVHAERTAFHSVVNAISLAAQNTPRRW